MEDEGPTFFHNPQTICLVLNNELQLLNVSTEVINLALVELGCAFCVLLERRRYMSAEGAFAIKAVLDVDGEEPQEMYLLYEEPCPNVNNHAVRLRELALDI